MATVTIVIVKLADAGSLPQQTKAHAPLLASA
jgi:hypothetical protein